MATGISQRTGPLGGEESFRYCRFCGSEGWHSIGAELENLACVREITVKLIVSVPFRG